jgi:hypothetical protein
MRGILTMLIAYKSVILARKDMRRVVGSFAFAILCLVPTSYAQGGTSYFPATEFRDLDIYNVDRPQSWAKYLALFKEPNIYSNKSVRFSIRLTASPAFDDGLVIRISQNGSGHLFGVIKQLRRSTLTASSSTFHPDDAQLKRIRQALRREDFWNLGNHQTTVTTDGTELLLEVKEGDKYHVVYVGSTLDGPIGRIAKTLTDIAHMKFAGED